MNPITIIGGGLAGLTNTILPERAGLDVTLVEKKEYPFHRVCGEYVSNEALPLLYRRGIDPFASGTSHINQYSNRWNPFVPSDLGGHADPGTVKQTIFIGRRGWLFKCHTWIRQMDSASDILRDFLRRLFHFPKKYAAWQTARFAARLARAERLVEYVVLTRCKNADK